jgi:hypothetical protein
LRESDLIAVMGINKGLHLMYAATVAGHLDLGKARG